MNTVLHKALRFSDHAAMQFADASQQYVTDHSPLWRDGYEPMIAAGAPLAYGGPGGQRGVMTHDGQWRDSTGAFLVGELERLDQTLHEPLVSIKWSRDIDLREDVALSDEVSSFTLSTYGSAGGLGTGNDVESGGIAWASKEVTQVSGVGLDISKTQTALTLWSLELKYSIPELESAARLGRPVDEQKFAGLKRKHQMDIDRMVYRGSADVNATGLINHTLATNVTNVAAGVVGTAFAVKSADEILNDFNEILSSAWDASAWEFPPDRILLPPAQYGFIATQKVSQAGNESILEYVKKKNVAAAQGLAIDIFPSKWCIGAASGGKIGVIDGHDRMVAYTKDKERVRYPMTLLQRTPAQYLGMFHLVTYFCRLGGLELVYPETVCYRDGI